MNVVRTRVQQRDYVQSQTMRPRVVRIEIEILPMTPAGVQKQAVIALRSARIIGRQITKIRLRIGQVENTALVNVRRG